MERSPDTRQYEDILFLPNHRSDRHPAMPRTDRAAQFMPFAALTGYDAAVREEARLTDQKAELDDEALAVLNERLRMLDEMLPDAPEITVTYFAADRKKAGGAYRSLSGRVKRIDPVEGKLIMRGGTSIPLGDIWSIVWEEMKG